MSTLRERNRLRTRAEIAEAALTLFEEHGYEKTTVDQIAAAAGVLQRDVLPLLRGQGGRALQRRGRGGGRVGHPGAGPRRPDPLGWQPSDAPVADYCGVPDRAAPSPA